MDPVAKWFWSHWRHNSEQAPVIERNGEYLFFPYGMFRRGFEVSEDQVSMLDKLVGTTNQICFWLLFIVIPIAVYLVSFRAKLGTDVVIMLAIIVIYFLTLAFLIYYDTATKRILNQAEISSYRMTVDDHFSLINRDAPTYLRLIMGMTWNGAVSIAILGGLILYFDRLPPTIIFTFLAVLVFPVVFTVMLSLSSSLRQNLPVR